jgi:hypothetical protein
MKLIRLLALALAATLAGCASLGVGLGIPAGPFSLGLGLGSDGGVTAGVGAGYGPLGIGVGVNDRGQVTGNAGVGASVPLGGTPARVGVGTGTVLYQPDRRPSQGIPILPTRPVEMRRPAAYPADPVAP